MFLPGLRVIFARLHFLHFACIVIHFTQKINIAYKYILIYSVVCTFDFIQAHSSTFNDVCIAFLLHCYAFTCTGTHSNTFNPTCICMHSCSTTFQYIPTCTAFVERHIRVHVHFQCIWLTCCILLQCHAYHKNAFCCIQELKFIPVHSVAFLI